MCYITHIQYIENNMQKKEPRVENGVTYWECSKCHRLLPGTDYYSDTRTSNRLKAQCKQCHIITSIKTRDIENARRINREYMRRARRIDPQKYRDRELMASKNRNKNDKTMAREMLNRAVKTGKIIKPSKCSRCGKVGKITAHHPDYSKPLEVEWLCYECHRNN